MVNTFGQRLHSFSLAVDIVSNAVFLKVMEMVRDYLERELGICFMEVLICKDCGRSVPRRGLSTVWQHGGTDWAEPLYRSDGSFDGQVSYAFEKRQELWIVPREAQAYLRPGGNFVNLLSEEPLGDDFPDYQQIMQVQSRTSVILALKVAKDLVGVINMESPKYIKPSLLLKRELRWIADSVAHLASLLRASQTQSENTEHALQDLAEARNLHLPYDTKIFIASSAKADKRVINVLRTAVALFQSASAHWSDNQRQGDINEHIWEDISASEVGICYLSEPCGGGEFSYQDNANVLFEAGMMHALTHSGGRMRAWIPIRETASPKVPFNFVTERAIEVPRHEDGRVNEHELSVVLEKRLEHLLGEQPSTPR